MSVNIAVKSVGTALPEFKYTTEAVIDATNGWLSSQPDKRASFERFVRAAKTAERSFVMPVEEILRLNGLKGRAEFFERAGPKLGVAATNLALNRAQIKPSQVGSLLFTSCTVPSIPSIDALILEEVGFNRTVNRIPIYQHGCAAGVVGLGAAFRMAQLGKPVVLNAVELCSLVFHSDDPNPAELVGSAIFADGAAAATVAQADSGLMIVDHQSYLLPNSRHLMGYDLRDSGFHLRLDKELPKSLLEMAPACVEQFLASHSLTTSDVAHWLFHPGGVRILDLLEAAFELRPEQAQWSRQVLSSVGNISSATVLFVLERFMQREVIDNGDYALMLGIGPGLTIELVLFKQIN